MQDRFKFRVWDTVDCEYIEDSDIVRLTQYGKFVFNNATNGTEPELNSKRFIFEQSIGLKDKNRKLIYENDFIQAKNGNIYLIKWCQEKLGFVARTNNPNDVLESLDISSREWEIIGNIHENVDLLNDNN